MQFLELVAARRSVRRYLDRPVEREKVERCLEAARLAPSASNSQPWWFVVVDDPAQRRAVAQATFDRLASFNRFSLQAPVLVAMVTEQPKLITQIGGAIKNRPYALIDIGIAAAHFCLQAAELGLGTCMMGWFDEKKVKGLLGIPAGKRVDLVIAVGYPAEEAAGPKRRKSLAEISSYNGYGREYGGGN